MPILRSILSFFGSDRGLTQQPGLQSGERRSQPTAPAAPVNFDTALSVSAWWAGCRLLAETVAGLPINFYRIDGQERKLDNTHPLWEILNVRPNRYQTKNEFWETQMLNLVTSGNCYAGIQRSGSGRITALMPMLSAQVNVEVEEDGSLGYYHLTNKSQRFYTDEQVFHSKIFGNGVIGLSPLSHAANSLGIAISSENRIGSIYKNGGKPTGVLMIDKVLNKEQRQRVREEMAELASGNDDNLFVLEAGMKYQAVSMKPEDIELLESRRFQLEDVARFLGVPSVLINDTAGSTTWGSGVQQIIEGFYKLNLRPYLERFESGIKRHLMTPSDARKWEVEFDFDTLLRMDKASRLESYNKGINAGVITPNEARSNEGLLPKAGGDNLLVNSTMVPLSNAINNTDEKNEN